MASAAHWGNYFVNKVTLVSQNGLNWMETLIGKGHRERDMKENAEAGIVEPSATGKAHTANIFGIGSAGLNLLEQLSQEGVPSDLLIAVHSDAAALLPCPAGQRLQLER